MKSSSDQPPPSAVAATRGEAVAPYALDRWAVTARAATTAAIIAVALELGRSLSLRSLATPEYFFANLVSPGVRRRLMIRLWLAGILAVVAILVTVLRRRREAGAAERALDAVRCVAVLAPLSFVPALMNWRLWHGRELIFLPLALGLALTTWATARASLVALARFRFGSGALDFIRRHQSWVDRAALPLVIVGAGAYAAYFGYHTVAWHQAAQSGWDLAIEDNILFNLLHGEAFFKASPIYGPSGSHLGRHATLISFLLLPAYALHQSPATLLVIQALALGAAAVPLFLFARGRLGARLALLLALVYLLHPAVHGANLYEFHYLKLGLLPFWTTLFFLDRGRWKAASLCALLTVLVREDIAAWVALLGAWALLWGRAPRWGLSVAALATLYLLVIKFGVMPQFSRGEDELVHMYSELVPKNTRSFAGVLATAAGNPTFTLSTLLDDRKLIFALQIFTPLVLLPLRTAQGWFLTIPGLVFCFLSTKYYPLIDIGYQYSVHCISCALFACVLVLQGFTEPGSRAVSTPPTSSADAAPEVTARWVRRAAASLAMLAGTLVLSYQYGAVLQTNTARGGPFAYRFEPGPDWEARTSSLRVLLAMVPPQAVISASALTIPQVSTRPNAYSLSLGIWDAEYLLIPMNRAEFVEPEVSHLRQALADEQFGVVRIEGPFAVLKRGAPTTGNSGLLHQLRL